MVSDKQLVKIIKFLITVKCKHFGFGVYMGLTFVQLNELEEIWTVNKVTELDERYLELFKFFKIKVPKADISKALWKAAIDSDFGWGYYRFLCQENFTGLIGDKSLLPSVEETVPESSVCKRVCILLARTFHENKTFQKCLEIQLKVPPHVLAYGVGECSMSRHVSVLKFFNILESGFHKSKTSEFWKRVWQAARDAHCLSYYLSWMVKHGFQQFVPHSEETVDGAQPEGDSHLDSH